MMTPEQFAAEIDETLNEHLMAVSRGYHVPMTDQDCAHMSDFLVSQLFGNPTSAYLVAQLLTAATRRLQQNVTNHA